MYRTPRQIREDLTKTNKKVTGVLCYRVFLCNKNDYLVNRVSKHGIMPLKNKVETSRKLDEPNTKI